MAILTKICYSNIISSTFHSTIYLITTLKHVKHTVRDNLFCKQLQEHTFQTITIGMHTNYNGLKCVLLDRISVVLPEPVTVVSCLGSRYS